MIFRLFEEVEPPKSPRSTSATLRPRSAASHATQAPSIPPPTTRTSNRAPSRLLRSRFTKEKSG